MAALAIAAAAVEAQDTARGVRIGITYQPGATPGIVVLPIAGPNGDSIRAILERDLRFSNRFEVVEQAATGEPVRGVPNYDLYARLGAVELVQVTPTAEGMHLVIHNVGQRRPTDIEDLPLVGAPNSRSWRAGVHAASDLVQFRILNVRGIASTRIAYARNGRLHIVDSDGAFDEPIATQGRAMSPAWDPRGRRLAYHSMTESGYHRIMVHDLGTGSARPVGTTRGVNISPVFAPDGAVVVYSHGVEEGTDLYAVSADGTGPARRLTAGRGSDNVSPSFSPDGRRVVFTSGRAGSPQVYIMEADGTNPEPLTSYVYGEQSYRSNPDFAPDGRQIAYQSQLAGTFQIMTMNLRDRSTKQHTSEGANEDPSWAPDGRHLVFSSTRSGARQLWVLDTESGRVRQLTRSGGARLPAWSPSLAAR